MITEIVLDNMAEGWKLPSQWKWIPIEEICDIVIGGTPSRSNPKYWGVGYTWVSISDLNGGVITNSKEQITDLGIVNSNVKLIEPGTVLMSFKLTIGKLAIAGKELYTNEAIAALPIKADWQGKFDRDFLFYALKAIPLSSEVDLSVKGKTLNKKKIANILLPVPCVKDSALSINIQRRVVARIEVLLDEVRACRSLINKTRQEAEKIINVALGEMAQIITHVRKLLSDVIESKPRNGWSPKCDNNPQGIPVLKLGAVLRFRYNSNEVKLTSEAVDKIGHYWLNPGDILISRSNTPELVGHAAIYSGEPSPCIYPDLMMKMTIKKSKADSRFLIYWLQTQEVRDYIQSHASGASSTMKKITQSHVCNIPFPDISVEEQRQWTSYLDHIKNEVDEIIKKSEQDAKLLDYLEQSILERAFRGEL